MPKVTQLAKTDAGYYVTTLPTRHSSHWPTLFPVACSEPGIQEALNSSFISFSSASWLRPWQSGQRAEGRGHRGRPYSGTCGYNSARVMQAVSLHGLQPTSAGCLHLRQVYQANLWTYHLPTHPFIVHTNYIWAPAPCRTDTCLTALNQTQSLPSSYLPSLGKTGK